MSQETSNDPVTEAPSIGLPNVDLDFFRRVYRTTLLLLILVAAIVGANFGARAALGLLLGTGISLGALAMLEWSVRRHVVHGGTKAAAALLGASIAKLFGITIILVAALFAAQRGWISLFWVLPGVALPHLVIGLKLLGRKLIAQSPEEARAGMPGRRKQ